MLESLGCYYLRHVKNCWLVQANWKASDTWPKRKSAHRLEAVFQEMRARLDGDGNDVLKDTKDAGQLLRQAEIDILGLDFNGDVHAVEVAFHEAGLNYPGPGGTRQSPQENAENLSHARGVRRVRRRRVCSQWWAEHHLHNSRSLLARLKQLRIAVADSPDTDALDRLVVRVSAYIDRNSSDGQ